MLNVWSHWKAAWGLHMIVCNHSCLKIRLVCILSSQRDYCDLVSLWKKQALELSDTLFLSFPMKCKLVTRAIKTTYVQGTQLWFLCYFGLVLFLQYKPFPKLVIICYMVVCIYKNKCIKISSKWLQKNVSQS